MNIYRAEIRIAANGEIIEVGKWYTIIDEAIKEQQKLNSAHEMDVKEGFLRSIIIKDTVIDGRKFKTERIVMDKHPEQNDREVYVGNVSILDGERVLEYLFALRTARLGNVTYDIEGRIFFEEGCRPLFVGDIEIEKYREIMEARFLYTKPGIKKV